MAKISEVHRGGRETLEVPGLPGFQDALRGVLAGAVFT